MTPEEVAALARAYAANYGPMCAYVLQSFASALLALNEPHTHPYAQNQDQTEVAPARPSPLR